MALTKKMAYLSAVINEALRCYTLTPGGGRKAPPEGAMVSGYFVPGNVSQFAFTLGSPLKVCSVLTSGSQTIVTVFQLSGFTLPNNFAMQSVFLPERWLPSDHPDRPAATLNDRQDVFQPFGFGPKACIGKGIALAEIKLILARMVWRFDFELVDNKFDIEKQKAFLFRDKPELNVLLTSRKASGK